jgi:hypothetical protein
VIESRPFGPCMTSISATRTTVFKQQKDKSNPVSFDNVTLIVQVFSPLFCRECSFMVINELNTKIYSQA